MERMTKNTAIFLVASILVTSHSCLLAQEIVPRLETAEVIDSTQGLIILPDSSRLVVGNMNGWIDVLQLPLGEKLRVLRGPKFLGGLTHSLAGDVLAGFRLDRPDIFLYETTNWTPLKPIRIGDVRIKQIAFSPDGKTLAVLSSHLVRGDINNADDGKTIVHIWDFIHRNVACEVDRSARCMAFSPNSNVLAMAVAAFPKNDNIDCWDVRAGTIVKGGIASNQKDIRCIAFLPGGMQLASAGEELHREGEPWYHDNVTIKIWDRSTGSLLQTLRGHSHRITALIPLPGEKLISGSSDGTIRLWDLKTSREIGKLDMGPTNCAKDGSLRADITNLSLSPDGQYLACSMSLAELRIWRLLDVFPTLGKRGGRNGGREINGKARGER
jgi:WD40 repeat protein